MRMKKTTTETGPQIARRRVSVLRKNLRTAPAVVEAMNLEINMVRKVTV